MNSNYQKQSNSVSCFKTIFFALIYNSRLLVLTNNYTANLF